MKRAVFLDRDGVLNRTIVLAGKPYPPASLEQLEILPGVQLALASFKQAGFHTLVVTNQPDVGKGLQKRHIVENMHLHLRNVLDLDDIFVCYHTDQDECACRKPRPGMLLDAARRWQIDLSASFMVGDRWRDIEAGQRAGCRTFLVQGSETYHEQQAQNPGWVVSSLLEASQTITSLSGRNEGVPQWLP
jgi:D-glycero-D-manno-heptose 1,7-bisphosphate phosphatase